MEFWMPMIPPKITSQMKGISNGRVFTKPAVLQAKAKLKAHLAKHRPDTPMLGAISFRAYWVFPWLKKDAKISKTRDIIPHTSKPDCDNINKALADCMTELGFWKDDSQVVDLHVQKHRGSKPGIMIIINRIVDGA